MEAWGIWKPRNSRRAWMVGYDGVDGDGYALLQYREYDAQGNLCASGFAQSQAQTDYALAGFCADFPSATRVK